MKTVKILHCADLHFDTPFYGLSLIQAEKRREDLRETFGRIIERVKQEEIAILLMSGDLFDNANVMKTTIEYMIKKFNEIPDTKIFIAPGNHDFYSAKSYYALVSWPSHVHIFKNKLEKVDVPEHDTCVYGIGFSQSHERNSLVQRFRVENQDKINLMVIHGEVVGKGQATDYHPIELQFIEDSGLDYIALGHRHTYSGINKNGKTYWAYSGNPEGRGFDELGTKGVILGEAGKDYCSLDFKELCKRKYYEEKVDITGALTYEEITDKILRGIQDRDKHKNYYKIILRGELSSEFSPHMAVLEEKLAEQFYFLKLIDETKLQIDFNRLQSDFSLKGIFVRKIKERLEQAENQKEIQQLERALKMGMSLLEDKEVWKA